MQRQIIQLELINGLVDDSSLQFNRDGIIIGRQRVNDVVTKLKSITEDTTVLVAAAGGVGIIKTLN